MNSHSVESSKIGPNYLKWSILKVSQFLNVLLVSSNRPKNKWKFCKDFCPSLKYFVSFWIDLKTPKGHFEINCLLEIEVVKKCPPLTTLHYFHWQNTMMSKEDISLTTHIAIVQVVQDNIRKPTRKHENC